MGKLFCRLFGHQYEYPKFDIVMIPYPENMFLAEDCGISGALVDRERNIISEDPTDVEKFRRSITHIYDMNLINQKINNTRVCIKCLKREV